MTSGNFHIVSLSLIDTQRETRQRRELPDIPILADSIKRLGLIHPITVTRDLVLVAGERRLEACRSLGWDQVTIQYQDEADEHTLRAIELEENVKRVDIPWQDQCRAILEYHSIRSSEEDKWTLADTGAALGITKQEVSDKLGVARELVDGNKRVVEAPKYSVARGIVSRTEARRDDQALAGLQATIKSVAPSITAAGTPRPVEQVTPDSIINASFNEWAPNYSGVRFNLIHCDFPYGIDAGTFNQGSAAAHGGYDDSEDTYWTLCRTLCDNLDKLGTESCHLMFWFSMKFYQPTLDFFAKHSDFIIDPFPLIWMKTDNVGILPDPSRGPRRIYETALLGRRGDRKVVQAVANAYGAPTVRERHMSEKPEPMIKHFFRMLVDEHSLVLDPTCGSGSAIRAAEAMGAKYALGLELNPEYAVLAQGALTKARSARKAAAAAPVKEAAE